MKITVEELKEKFGDNVYDAEDFIRDQMPQYPDRPTRPRLAEHNSESVKTYGKQLKTYEKELKEYEQKKAIWGAADTNRDELLKAYVKDLSGFNKLPEKSKEKVWRKAYDDGHSGGYSDIYSELCDLVDLFD